MQRSADCRKRRKDGDSRESLSQELLHPVPFSPEPGGPLDERDVRRRLDVGRTVYKHDAIPVQKGELRDGTFLNLARRQRRER